VAVSNSQAAAVEQGARNPSSGPLGSGIYLYQNVRFAREMASERAVVLEIRINVGRCHRDGNLDAGYDSAWQESAHGGMLCIRDHNGPDLRVVQRIYSPMDMENREYRWFFKNEEGQFIPFASYDSLILESYFCSWEEDRGGNSVQLALRHRCDCQIARNTQAAFHMVESKRILPRRNKSCKGVGALLANNKHDLQRDKRKISACTQWASWADDGKAASRCVRHKSEGMFFTRAQCSIFQIDFASMEHHWHGTSKSLTTRQLLEQSTKQSRSDSNSLMPPAPLSSLGVLQQGMRTRGRDQNEGNLERRDMQKHSSSLCLAGAWKCCTARRKLNAKKQQLRDAAASFLQGKIMGAQASHDAQNVFLALWDEHLLNLQVHQFELSLTRVLGKPYVALFQVSDLLRNTSDRVKTSKAFPLIINSAVAACLKKDEHELVKVLMDQGAFLDLEGINVENVNVWLSRETPQSVMDNCMQDADAPVPMTIGVGDTDAEAEHRRQAAENLESARRVNAWLRDLTPDNTVDELTALKRDSVRLREQIENQRHRIQHLETRLRHLEGVENHLRLTQEILQGKWCCFCKNRPVHARHSKKQIGEMCVECQEVVKESNDQIEVREASGLKWENAGVTRPTGSELSSTAVASALEGNTEFTQKEWESFGICDLQPEHFIKAGDFYYKPAVKGKAFLAKYGSLGEFYKGLDVFSGRPLCGGANQILKEMQEECAGLLTGSEEISTSNYGRVTTTLALEWEFVFSPNPDKAYPGSHIIDGHRCGKPILDPATGEQLKDSAGKPRFYPGRVPVSLSKFINHPTAKNANLSKPEVLALRLYTGPCYAKLNTLLRNGSVYIAQERQAGRNTFTTTISAINSGIRKLLQCSVPEPEAAVLFRGTGNMKLPPNILRETCSIFVVSIVSWSCLVLFASLPHPCNVSGMWILLRYTSPRGGSPILRLPGFSHVRNRNGGNR